MMAGDEVFGDDATSGPVNGDADWYVCPDCGWYRPVWDAHDCRDGDDA